MPEFISVTFPNASTELNPLPGAGIDPDYLIRYARNLDDYGFNYTLVPYDSSSYDPFTIGATILAVTKQIKVIIALRPNTLPPTVAAKALATHRIEYDRPVTNCRLFLRYPGDGLFR